MSTLSRANHRREASDPFLRVKAANYTSGVKTGTETAASSGVRQKALLARSEVSRILGVSPNTVTRWAREGRLPCLMTLGGHHRFDRELVERLRASLSRAGGEKN